MFRTMAYRPEIFEMIIAHMEAVLNTGTLSKALKELVIADVAVESHPYCLASHTTIARKLGWTEVQIEDLHHAADSEEFSEQEKVAIHLAEVVTLNAWRQRGRIFTARER